MQPIEASTIRIDRVVESEGPLYPPEVLLPGLTPEQLEAERAGLTPRCLDETSGLLVMSVHSFLLRTRHHTILIDTCVGNDKERPGFGDWHRQQSPYLARLAALGVRCEDVDYVLCTHLHPDHVGWNTRLADGRWVPTFPNAAYLFGRIEWDQWSRYASVAPEDREGPYPEPVSELLGACYRDSVSPVVAAGLATLVDDGHQLDDGIALRLAPGHTPGNAVVEIDVPDLRAVLAGDVVHHPIQVRYPALSSAFCFDPEQSAATRRAFLERAASDERLVLPAHFPAPTAGRVRRGSDGFRFLFMNSAS